VIVPFTPGSGVDIVARMVSQKLGEYWGQSVLVENHIGAGGTLGADVVAKSPPDGYTLLVNSTAHAVNVALYSKLPYDPLKDFVDVSPLVAQPYVLLAGASAGVKTVSDLIATGKVKPGQLKFGSAGTASGTHIVAEKFRLAAEIDVVHLPNKGGPEANADAMAGRQRGSGSGSAPTSARRTAPRTPPVEDRLRRRLARRKAPRGPSW
jgi:tripartite-type tricarboxylate transporter receptor subunit TctC